MRTKRPPSRVRRTRRIALALAIAFLCPATASNATTPFAAEAPRLRSPNDPNEALTLELRRWQLPTGEDPTTAGSLWATHAPAEPPGLAASLRPEIEILARATDPQVQLTPLYLDPRTGEEVDPAWRARVSFLGDVLLAPHTSAHLRFSFDSEGQNDPRNRTRDFSQLGASNNLDEAYLRFATGRVAFLVGRRPLRWGPERLGGLLLGTHAPAPELLEAQLRWSEHRLHFFTAQLSTENRPPEDGRTLRRWLYGHRADLYFRNRSLRVGLSELALVAGESESLNPRYLNPVSVWAQVQVEEDGDDGTQVNVFHQVDLDWRPDPRLRLYGSLLVDDLQIDSEGRDRNPDQLAWATGFDLRPAPDGPFLLAYEYRRIGSWTYIHRGQGTDFQQYERPLGAEEGPDTDRHDLRIDFRPNLGTRSVFAEIQRMRRGTNRLSTETPRAGNSGRPYPLGTVEERWIVAAGVQSPLPGLPRKAKAALWAAFHDIRNLSNQPAHDERIWEIRAQLVLTLPALAGRP